MIVKHSSCNRAKSIACGRISVTRSAQSSARLDYILDLHKKVVFNGDTTAGGANVQFFFK